MNLGRVFNLVTSDRVSEWFGRVDASGFREFMQNLVSGVVEDWVVDVPPGPPGEIDVVLTRRDGRQKYVRLVQSADAIDASRVEEAVGAAEDNGVREVVVIANTGYTDEARRRAHQHQVDLIDVDGLRRLVRDRGLDLPESPDTVDRARSLVADWPTELREEALGVVRFVDGLASFTVELRENEYSTDVCFTQSDGVGGRREPVLKLRFADAAVSMIALLRTTEGYTRIGELSLGADNDSRRIKERIEDELTGRG